MDFSETAPNPLESDDPGVWGALIDASGPESLLVFIERRLSSKLRARYQPEDLLQESLLQVWRDRFRFQWRGIRRFRAYVQAVIENRIRDIAERDSALKRGVHRTISIHGSENGVRFSDPISTTTSGRVMSRRETARRMSRALESLDPAVREVVYLRLFEERSMPEIAEQIGIGLSAAKHRFRRGAEEYRSILLKQRADPEFPE